MAATSSLDYRRQKYHLTVSFIGDFSLPVPPHLKKLLATTTTMRWMLGGIVGGHWLYRRNTAQRAGEQPIKAKNPVRDID